MMGTVYTPQDPRYASEKARGMELFAADKPHHREQLATAFALIATALPERRSDTPSRMVAVPKPRQLAPVRACVVSEQVDRIHRLAGGR